MNPLLEQFLIEGRDLLDAAGAALLDLERAHADAAAMNSLFRAVHTLKGTSGLFEMAPLTSLVHAGEDLLAQLRSTGRPITPAMVDLLLAAFDLTRTWLEAIERSGGDLPAEAAEVAATRAQAIRALMDGGDGPAAASAGGTAAPHAPPAWVATLPPAELATAEAAARAVDRDLVAVEYCPDAQCFFRGEDPLNLVRQVPELVALQVLPPPAWPALAEMDAFASALSFRLLCTAPREDVQHLFRYCEDVAISAFAPSQAPQPDAGVVTEVLASQLHLLDVSCEPECLPGRASAIGMLLRRVMTHLGRALDEATLGSAVRQTAEGHPEALAALLREVRAPAAPPPLPPLAAAAAAGGTAVAADPAEAPAPSPELRSAPVTLRVDQSKIDVLMNLVGELIVAKNSLSYLARKAEAGASARDLARDIKDQQAVVHRLAEEMQSAVMAIRMLPVNHVFQRFPRLVRDLSRRLGKQVDVVLEGEETEADKNMIEALSDPLLHMIRNSLDHGLESAEERMVAGKKPHGTLRLAAEQQNETIVVTVSDDGRGIDPKRVRRKAVERGLLDDAAAEAMPDEEALRLVFRAGFSTSEQVSDLSGRGVGMDVVRSTVEKVGGWVDLSSKPGQGTTVRMTLPLTMAVTRIMTIECAGHLFGIPMNTVVESVRLPASAVHCIRGQEAFVLRDRIVPLLRLDHLLELPVAPQAAAREDDPVLVLRAGQATVGLVIDAFRERMEAIVRPLEGMLSGLRGFVGTTLLGDGRVLLILDVAELV
ncbi:Signal transduction histidine kinase CheA [Rhodovastum atsumiense]|uniref:Chemotaxis protein CheA n=1 Tax=Rhodovastum atsumiense TaxID=504468 RepID=A0A5M6IPA0_9PROT|nr:chemotaxis protein CheA [Rhodovastum atsumiense]KAA5610104.1 chemotaxis protein CheA [Rhodovastum atsumiense]CAH2601424.1 Signal transduction histidine kinase CheA [Rhodovastum atsumiense]